MTNIDNNETGVELGSFGCCTSNVIRSAEMDLSRSTQDDKG